ncbi:hypothetical protein SJ550_26000, partial [Serratia marcescens]
EVFAIMKKQTSAKLQAAGAVFYDWHTPHAEKGHVAEDETITRFVTSFATTSEDIRRFGDLIT